jgi:streptogramin lyase
MIIFARNSDHDQPGIAIMIARNCRSPSPGIPTHTGEVSEYEPPTKFAGLDTLDVDRKHDLIWVAEDQAEKLARFDPRTKKFEEFSLPNAVGVKRISVDPTNPNRVWWCTGNTPGASLALPDRARAGYLEVTEPAK